MENKNLHNIKETGFKVPQNYFEALEDTILNEVKLKSIVSESGLKAPKGYLDNFNVSVKEETKVISIFNKKNIIFVSSIAAAIILFFSLNIFNTSTTTLDDIDTASVDDYILNETEISELTTLFQDSDLSEAQFIDYTLSDEALDSFIEDLDDLYSE
ncbi:hypothetical protein [Lacinutrix sp. 5H-3-7-4]|uniref:hypothetical protein n=1 Tax=Lacinutrix sp. (strain 5H-3-7-4) TaxID=983544 RepID=UPI00020A3372|nr:hypothetical protein [Lacinutrix sp. 5H-3-7-4]AEH01833.1 hypothetical protein Lacal_1987 [Lacinutrix sp. 5H-3-7-4]